MMKKITLKTFQLFQNYKIQKNDTIISKYYITVSQMAKRLFHTKSLVFIFFQIIVKKLWTENTENTKTIHTERSC